MTRVLRRIAGLATPKLSFVMAALFVCLSIPILIFILLYNYQKNTAAIIATLDDSVARTIEASTDSANQLIGPVGGMLRLLAGVAAVDPDLFRTDESAELLYRALASLEQIDSVFVTFEDGFHRVVTRIDDDRRRSDPRIPLTANWHSSYVESFSAGQNRARHRVFYDFWGSDVGSYREPTTFDFRTLEGYADAKTQRMLVVTEPLINPDTGAPIISIRVPIIRNDRFLGAASASITMDVLTRFMLNQRPSQNSTSIIVDPHSGKIIASAVRAHGARVAGRRLTIATLDSIDDDDVRAADVIRGTTARRRFLFVSPADGQELSATFARLPEAFGRPWEAIILTPTDDFVGGLKTANRHVVMVIVGLTIAELLLIYALATRLSRPIESVSRELKLVEDLLFEDKATRASKIREIAQLQSAAALLRNSLRSFSSFVPMDVVRKLVRSGQPLTLGVEPRFLTIFFSDLENFSSHADTLAHDDLLQQMSDYFEQVSRAVTVESGTVDKFIGDGVMAFWGAPEPLADHALRACAGALRAARRMDAVNARWRAEGRLTIRVRIGLHSAEVLVGNVGSSERLSYTAMGDGVNVAARLEGINKLFGTTICISETVVQAAGPGVVVRPLRRIAVRGHAHELMVYELLGIAGSADPELAASERHVLLCARTAEASQLFERGDRAGAARRYRAILDAFPADPVAAAQLAQCGEGERAEA